MNDMSLREQQDELVRRAEWMIKHAPLMKWRANTPEEDARGIVNPGRRNWRFLHQIKRRDWGNARGRALPTPFQQSWFDQLYQRVYDKHGFPPDGFGRDL